MIPLTMVLRLHSMARWLWLRRVPVVPRIIKGVIQIFFKCVLAPECSIGPGTTLHHHGWAIGLHPNVTIGRDCNIYSLVVIRCLDDDEPGPPARIVIGDGVTVHSGAKVLCRSGTLTIGEGSTIGPNSAVESDVPAYSLVAGVPARITPKTFRKEPARTAGLER